MPIVMWQVRFLIGATRPRARARQLRDQLIDLMGGLYKHGHPSGSNDPSEPSET